MTELLPVRSEIDDAFDHALSEANAWRGRCVNLFARGEFAIGTVLAMRSAPGATLPMLVSQKIKQLISVVTDADGVAAAELADFASLLDTRTALTHGCAKVWIDRLKDWRVSFKWRSGGSILNPYKELSFTSAESSEFQRRLHASVQRLEQALSKTQT